MATRKTERNFNPPHLFLQRGSLMLPIVRRKGDSRTEARGLKLYIGLKLKPATPNDPGTSDSSSTMPLERVAP